MVELTQVGGLWVPAPEAEVLAAKTTRDGALALDGTKIPAALEYCKEFHTAIDVGAHIGSTTIPMAPRFERVIAFEAIADTFFALTRNTEQFSNVSRYNYAVSDKPGVIHFWHLARFGQLSHVPRPNDIPSPKAKQVPVEARTIDSFGFENVSFMKIDVEGFELCAVEGAIQTIKRWRPTILIEQTGYDGKYGHQPNAASILLESLGMERVEGLAFRRDRVYRFK